jgi:hypothetical protein
MLLQLHPAKARQLADLIVEISPVPKATADAAVRTILGSTATTDDELAALPMLGRAGWPEVRDAICRAIIASATPERDDRLFPGDIAQFHPGGGTSRSPLRSRPHRCGPVPRVRRLAPPPGLEATDTTTYPSHQTGTGEGRRMIRSTSERAA